jgi:hypothetical protein
MGYSVKGMVSKGLALQRIKGNGVKRRKKESNK